MKNQDLILAVRCISVLVAAELLGVSTGLCYRMIHDGTLPAVRLGRRLLIPVKALDALLSCGKGVVTCPGENGRQQTVTGPSTTAEMDAGVHRSG